MEKCSKVMCSSLFELISTIVLIGSGIYRNQNFIFLSLLKKMKQEAVCISLTAERVYPYLKKTFSKYKFMRFLSDIDCVKSISINMACIN